MKHKSVKSNIEKLNQFQNLDFQAFKVLAEDKTLSPIEKIGFPQQYRKNKEHIIFEDILGKLTNLSKRKKVVFDIGCGCSDLPKSLIQLCNLNSHKLFLFDSKEMLSLLPINNKVNYLEGMFPNDFKSLIQNSKKKVDVILCYSVFHYIFNQQSLYSFFDQCLSLLAPGGQFLLGDIPNVSKRKRFFSSQTGIKFHKKFMKTNKNPKVSHLGIEFEQIDDGIMIGLLARARNFGYDAYLVPQNSNLPMANRREDLLIVNP